MEGVGSGPSAWACNVDAWGSSHHSDRQGTSWALDATEESRHADVGGRVAGKC